MKRATQGLPRERRAERERAEGRRAEGGHPAVPRRGWRGAGLRLGALAALLAALAASRAAAAPARGDPEILVQPDGTRLRARPGGDEFFNWVALGEGAEARVIARGPDGYWRYVTLQAGRRVLSPSRAGLDAVPAEAATLGALPALRAAAARAQAEEGGAWLTAAEPGLAPTSDSEPMLVLLVQFTDRVLTTTAAQWAASMFGATGKTVRTYYDQASRNAFQFTPAAETDGAPNDGIVAVTLGYAHPDPGGATGDANRQITKDALLAADGYVDFASFDSDGSKGLSSSELHIVVVVAGYEESYSALYSPSVWGHRWALFGSVSAPRLDGVWVAGSGYGGGYTQQGELHGDHIATIGILCHELGHDLGLIDLYDTDDSSEGIGGHGLMGSGSWGRAAGEQSGATPTLPCAWSRIALGFLAPATVGGPGVYTAVQASDPLNGNAFKIPTTNAEQYFLIENRQLTGFDEGLYRWFSVTSGGAAGGGLAVWHVDESRTSNTNELRKKVDLEEANEGLVGKSELDTNSNRGNRHHYFYSGHVTQFDDTTVPNSRLYDDVFSGVAIGSVSGSGTAMTFTVSGATQTLEVVSAYGMAEPPVGVHSYAYGTTLVCRVTNSPAVFAGAQETLTCLCTGWTGSGSAPAAGGATSTPPFLLTSPSTVAWHWVATELALSNQTVTAATSRWARDALRAGDGYTVAATGAASFGVSSNGAIRLTPGFGAASGSVLRAAPGWTP